MLRKGFRIKNNSTLKSSEKKKLYSKVISTYPSLSEAELQKSFPTKEAVQQVRILTGDGESLSVFVCQGQPMIINLDERIIPTVYFLWIYPNLLHSFTITQYVLDKLRNGADLMVPGIIQDKDPAPFGTVSKGEIVSINLLDNKASVGIGFALISSVSMKVSGRGKAVHIIHTVDDGLFKIATTKIPMPTLAVDAATSDTDHQLEVLESSSEFSEELDKLTINTSSEEDKVFSLDDILLNAFLHTIKTCGNKIELPILTNLFYKSYLLKNIPETQDFDIKKTKYKKLSTFLNEMEKEGIIKLATSCKDVQSITEIVSKHDLLMNYTYIFQDQEETEQKEEKDLLPSLEIIEGFVVNNRVEPLFSQMGYKSSDQLSTQEVRKIITEYVKNECLQDPIRKELVNINPILAKITKSDATVVEWKWLMDSILESMGNYYEVKKKGIRVNFGKGKLPLIDIYIRIKSGHKKVTVADYLEVYGVDVPEISRVCQRALAASTTINKLSDSNKKGLQFQIQGCHVPYIKKLLIDKYCIPKKYISDGS